MRIDRAVTKHTLNSFINKELGRLESLSIIKKLLNESSINLVDLAVLKEKKENQNQYLRRRELGMKKQRLTILYKEIMDGRDKLREVVEKYKKEERNLTDYSSAA